MRSPSQTETLWKINKYSETKNTRNVIVHSNVCFENRHFSRCRPHAKFKKYQNKLNCLLWKSPSSLNIAPTRDLKEKLSKHRRANSNFLVWKSPLGGKLDSRKWKTQAEGTRGCYRLEVRIIFLKIAPRERKNRPKHIGTKSIFRIEIRNFL